MNQKASQDTNLVTTPAVNTYPNDEIDLAQLFSSIWATRVKVIFAVLVTVLAYGVYLSFSYLGKAQKVTYTQIFDLTFEGLSNGKFPNGTPFVMSDIVSPVVLTRVYKNNNLEQQGLTLSQFSQALNIEPYSSEATFIKQRYEAQIGKNMPAAELQELQNRMQAELKQAQSGAVRISMQFEKDALSEAVASKVLLDVADTWAERAIDEQGVLKLSLPIYTPRIFDEKRFEALDYLIGIELLVDNIGLIEGNIAELKKQPNAGNIIDDISGLNLEDLQKTIQDIKEYDLRQLMDPVKELGLTRNEKVVRLYYDRQISELSLQKQFWEERARVTGETLSAYSSDGKIRTKTGETIASLGTPQLGDAFLDRLVTLSKQGDEQAFRQQLTQDILEYQNKGLELNRRMQEINLILHAVNNSSNKKTGAGAGAGAELRELYLAEVQESLPKVLQNLRELTAVAGRFHEQLGKKSTASISEIIMPQGDGFAASNPLLVSKKSSLVLVALSIGVGFISMLLGLMQGMMRNRKKLNNQ